MGKKSGSAGEKKVKEEKAKAFVLKVDMHCDCKGCNDKIRAAVKDITLLQGIESWDQSALGSKGELRLVATADPEKLQQRLHKATRKNVALLFPKEKDHNHKPAAGNNNKDAAAVQAQSQQTAWANHLLSGAGWNAHGGYQPAAGYATTAYPSWTVQQPDPYAAYSGGAAYPAAASGGWGAAYPAYPHPPAAHGHGAYGWHGHGY
ncbi:hypothetical protein QOZ80_2AG0150590 [Eleusine coracana subsp. coracana]|nr:hypothetical protein QOZ80_2AG0150590 [Eleusine coracana subsp. coracana]